MSWLLKKSAFLRLVIVERWNVEVATRIHDQNVSGPESVCADAFYALSQAHAHEEQIFRLAGSTKCQDND